MAKNKIVWSSETGDRRKAKKTQEKQPTVNTVDESTLKLELKRVTAGKGRAVIEIRGLPQNTPWCQKLAKDLKKSLGVGGTYKQSYVEIHGEKLDKVIAYLDSRNIKWKQTGG